jgi:hypothetical protein
MVKPRCVSHTSRASSGTYRNARKRSRTGGRGAGERRGLALSDGGWVMVRAVSRRAGSAPGGARPAGLRSGVPGGGRAGDARVVGDERMEQLDAEIGRSATG